MERKMFYELVAFCIQKNEGKYVNYYCDLKTENRPYYERVYKMVINKIREVGVNNE